MKSHKMLFTEYLKWKSGDPNVYGFIDWRLDQDIVQCDNCKRYGQLGDEVSYTTDNDHSNELICWNCRVRVWGWYNNDLALGGNCLKGHEVEFLLEQAKKFNIESPKKKFLQWGYD